ncbi:MAG: TRAP transporter substrate-binding protein [Gammaproteobacteria bacterium]|nr:MAG: TRAP transporter substrate-binding protein [Gammaproteobacteria bacterium]TDJ42784.1 MAG: TRAP transporter substrate-binding protein [Gammaproteobacteria bacterium]
MLSNGHTAVFVGLVLMLSACGEPTPTQAVAAAPAEERTFRWKLVTTWPKNLPALGTAPEHLAQMVDVMSRGRLKIKVYGAGELVPAFGVFDAVSQGTAQMGHGAAYYWRGKIPIAAMFTTVPFGLNAQEMNGWLHYGGGLELWRELYEPFDLIPMAAGNSGVQMAGWFNREINSLADIQGLKMRIPGLGGEVFQRAGGVAVVIPGGELFTALQTGVIDATEWVGPYNDLALGLHEIAKYYYYPGWHEPGATLEAIVNRSAWEELPDDLKMILETAARAVNQDMLDEFTARNNMALKTLIDDHGVELRRLPDDVLARFKELSAEVVAEVAGSDELARRIHDSYMQFRSDVMNYHRISEQAYINAR